VIDWTWAGFTHERSGRIVVDTATDDHGDPVPAATVESAR